MKRPINPGKSVRASSVGEPRSNGGGGGILVAILFGLAFGFLLQKGGVAKYHILVGQLLLQDFTVIKVMLTAILVGMIGVFTLHRLGRVKLHIKPTRLGPTIIGGLIFGAGFALIGYCPGTAAAALGQGNWDALFGMLGLVAGSYLYALFSGRLNSTVEKWGDKGNLTLPDLLRIRRAVFIPVFGILMIAALFTLEWTTVR
jgi:uncharacterized protein